MPNPSTPSPAEIEAARERLESLADALAIGLITYAQPESDAARRVRDVWAIRVLLAEQEAARRESDDSAPTNAQVHAGALALYRRRYPRSTGPIDPDHPSEAKFFGDARAVLDAARQSTPTGATNG